MRGNRYAAFALYDRTILGAKKNEYWQEDALANELAAKFYLDWGKETVATGYMKEAYYCYAKWGAIAKTRGLEGRYTCLLRPILQPRFQGAHLLEMLPRTEASVRISTHSTYSLSDESGQIIRS